MRSLLFIAALLLPLSAHVSHAASSDDNTPPKPTKTTKYCKYGKIWDSSSKSCVNPQHSSLSDDARYVAVRELAYAGQYENSLKVLETIADQSDSRVLTYYGFNNRKAGRFSLGMKYYNAALKANPNNLLVRSYMGQGYVQQGNLKAARVQLAQIQTRGGRDSWPETSLRNAIETGEGYSY